MLNRPANIYRERDSSSVAIDRPWQVDARPAARLVWLFLLICLPPVCVVGRLVHLQQRLSGEIVAASERTHETIEPIPTRNGRILAADGRVLARDAGQFDVLINYRWLEEPAEPGWLRRQALARLGRAERADSDRVAVAEQAVLTEREAAWRRLAQLTGRAAAELAQRRAAIQQRIERMVASVEQRQRRRLAAARHEGSAGVSQDAPVWQRAWHTIVTAVTTSPERDADPLVLPEQSADYVLLEGVTLEAAAEIESHPEQFPGLSTRVSSWREYEAGSLAAHVIGVRRKLADAEQRGRDNRPAGADPRDAPGELRGQTGVERTYDRYLHGLHGLRRTVRNRRGEVISSEIVRPPRPGRDVVLTLDVELQQRLEQLLDGALAERNGGVADAAANDGRSGTPPYGIENVPAEARAGASIVALDARTGAVLAAVSAPRFDLRIAANPNPDEWRRILQDPRQPLFHRAIGMTLPPGSTFKVLSAVALLESGRIHPDEKLFCQGYLDRPDRHRCYIYRHFGYGHGETDLNDALARSCNVYFFQAARRIGPEPMVEWAERLGFGQRLGIDLPGEAAGNVPRPPGYDGPLLMAGYSRPKQSGTNSPSGSGSSEQARWYPGDALGLAIGQSRLTVTPLQMARLMAVVANGGWMVMPHVVRGFGPSLAGENAPDPPLRPTPARISGLSESTLTRVREGLERVVAHPSGTGYKHVRLEEIAIAGKTGTAEVGAGRPDHAWFAGYVPADRPKIAFAVVIEHGGSGGAVAGTVARDMVRAMLELGLVE